VCFETGLIFGQRFLEQLTLLGTSDAADSR